MKTGDILIDQGGLVVGVIDGTPYNYQCFCGKILMDINDSCKGLTEVNHLFITDFTPLKFCEDSNGSPHMCRSILNAQDTQVFYIRPAFDEVDEIYGEYYDNDYFKEHFHFIEKCKYLNLTQNIEEFKKYLIVKRFDL